MEMKTTEASNEATSQRRQFNVPLGTEAIPRFVLSSAALGAVCAQQFLEEFREMLESADLRAKAPGNLAQKRS